jgi:hypothetical protein
LDETPFDRQKQKSPLFKGKGIQLAKVVYPRTSLGQLQLDVDFFLPALCK